MTYGVRTWGAGGALEMDTDSFTYQVIHNQTYKLSGRNAVVTVNIASFDPLKCVAVILPTSIATADVAREAMPYQFVAPGVIQIYSKHPREPDTSINSQIEFRLLVMRYAN